MVAMSHPYDPNAPGPESDDPKASGENPPDPSVPGPSYGPSASSGQDPYGPPASGPDPYGRPGAGSDPYGRSGAGQDPYGQPAGQDPYQPYPAGGQNPYDPGYGQQGYLQPGYGQPYGSVPQPHPQGTTVLVLGILGLVVCFIAGIVAVVMGNRALKEIDANPSAYNNRQSVVIGRILGIISIVLWAVIIVGYIVFFIVLAATGNLN